MKVLTWNINGVRAVQKDKTNLKKILDSLEADVVCLQETKVTRDMLDEPTAVVDGYESYFSFSRKKSGYSGTANYCKAQAIPVKAEEGLTGKLTTPNDSSVYQYGNMNSFSDEDLLALDEEGRCVITQHKMRLPTGEEKEVAIINVYVPRAGDREDRHEYKLQFLTLLQIRAEALLKKGIHVIILGDINTTHRQIDNCSPDEESLRKSSRIWLNQLLQQKERDKSIPSTDANLSEITSSSCQLEGGKFSDVYRQLHPLQENAFTNWCTMTGARQTNFGRRLDYILIDAELAKFTTHCEIMSDFEGSDHCPVIVTLHVVSIPAPQSPLLCSKFMPEFKGQQKKLSAFFTKAMKPTSSPQKDTKVDIFKQNSELELCKSTTSSVKPVTFTSLKRQSTVGVDKVASSNKKSKLNKKGSISDTKQISLTSFFSQKNSHSNKCQNSPIKRESSNNTSTVKSKQVPVVDCVVIDDEVDSNGISPSESNSDLLQMSQSSGSCEQLSSSSYGNESKTINCDSLNSNIDDETIVEQNKLTLNSETTQNSASSNSLKSHQSNKSQASAWKGLLGGLPPPPLCPGHKEACVLRTVKKSGPNQNKQFYVCARPDGASGNPQSRCDFFQWLTKKR